MWLCILVHSAYLHCLPPQWLQMVISTSAQGNNFTQCRVQRFAMAFIFRREKAAQAKTERQGL
jgi:hypothetical protein